jgi:phosphate transport system substrate-binding protein
MRLRLGIAALLAAAALVPAGCGGGSDSKGSATAKEVVVDGSSTVYLISRAAVESYDKVKPDIVVVADKHGTGPGFGKYSKGELDVVGASRPARPAEEKLAADAGMMPWTRYLVGYDGITVVVNSKNDFVKTLTVAQLKALFSPDSKVSTWKDLDPSWPDRRISLYSPDNDSGTFEFFTEAITGKSKSQRKGVQQSSDDNQLVTGVANDVDGLGYFGYAYYVENQGKLKAVAVQKDEKSPAILPTPETILDKTYTPLARPLFIYVKNASMARPEVAGFVNHYLDNIETLAKTAGYVPPTAEDVSANKKALATSTTTAKPAG